MANVPGGGRGRGRGAGMRGAGGAVNPPVLPGGGAGGRGLGGAGGAVNLPDAVRKLFFTNAAEIREMFIHYVRHHPTYPAPNPVSDEHVPGDTRVYQKHSKRARRGTCAFVTWFCDLHDEGYSLFGHFSIQSFGVDHLGYLKADISLLGLVRKSDENSVSSNMKVVSAIIEHDIHSSQQVPSDLGHLMNRLKLYSNDLSPWERQHASHFEEDEKSAFFFRMHSKLKNLEQMDPPLYKAILKIIETIPDSKDWLGKALLNTHLHVLLRYRKWDSKQARTLSNVVARFLNSTVPYVQDGDGLLTCRRHGHAHMEADASVDMVHMEAALYGAVEGLKAYHQMQYEADKAAFKQHQIASVDSLETRLLKPMPIVTATAVGQALEQFLSGAKFSLDEAKPGAAAAAIHVAKRATKSNRVIYLSMVQAAVNLANLTAQAKGGSSQPSQAPGKVAVKTSQGVQGGAPQANLAAVKVAGTSAQGVHGGAPQANQAAVEVAGTSSQGVQGGAPKAVQPIDMFNANDVDHMYNLIAPNLLVGFQRIMFDRKQCYRLTEDTKVPRLID